MQAKHLLPAFQQMGHEPAQHAWYGLQGGVLNFNGIPILPMGMDHYGNDIVEAHADYFKADIVISLMDVWVLHEYGKKKMRWIPYMPIDHDPIPEKIITALDGAYKIVSYSKYGKKALDAVGIQNTYIPHGVDCDTFQPADKRTAKENLKFDPGAFIVGMVAANKGIPSRKCFPENLTALSVFKQRHPDRKVHLYLHTFEGPQQTGLDLNKLLVELKFQPDEVTFCNQYKYICGMMDESYMANAYNAMDVLLAASMSEGFGIPLIEAQACGTPVITGDYTSMPELVFAGYKVPAAQKFWTPMNAWNYLPSIDVIVDGLEWAWQMRGNENVRTDARMGAIHYDWKSIVTKYWKPFLDGVAYDIAADKVYGGAA